MSKVTEVPARKKKGEEDGFHYVRVQKLPDTVTQGYDPVYAMDEQASRFCDSTYEHDEARSNRAFDVYKIPKADYAKVEAGLQGEANGRLVRPEDTRITSTTGSGNVRPNDDITMNPQTLDQVGAALPSSVQ